MIPGEFRSSWRGNVFSIEVDEADPWWKALMNRIFPNGVRKSGDPPPVIEVTVKIEGIEKTFRLNAGRLESIEYRGGIASTVFHFVEPRDYD